MNIMNLGDYLRRIGHAAATRPDIDTLRGVLRAHVSSVPFENLDVQLGRPVTTAVEDAYEKIVRGRRGGWCYEQNGLFGWALEEIGFDVTRVAAGVRRDAVGDEALANHLCLLVRVPERGETFLADVGFGGSLFDPVPLAELRARHEPFDVGLRRLDDGYWQFWEDAGDGEFNFDFRPEPASEEELGRKCRELQTDPDSTFVLNLVVQMRAPTSHVSLRGRVLTRRDSGGESVRMLDSPDQLVQVLADEFALDAPQTADLWTAIVARHETLFGTG